MKEISQTIVISEKTVYQEYSSVLVLSGNVKTKKSTRSIKHHALKDFCFIKNIALQPIDYE